MDSTISGSQVYLLHFKQPFKHARHYLGYAESLQVRLALHANGHGARLTQVVKASGGSWVLARTWPGGRDLEYRLKRWHSGVKLCPICQGKVLPPAPHTPGRRMPMKVPTRYFP